jgi:hypothetical protein
MHTFAAALRRADLRRRGIASVAGSPPDGRDYPGRSVDGTTVRRRAGTPRIGERP